MAEYRAALKARVVKPLVGPQAVSATRLAHSIGPKSASTAAVTERRPLVTMTSRASRTTADRLDLRRRA